MKKKFFAGRNLKREEEKEEKKNRRKIMHRDSFYSGALDEENRSLTEFYIIHFVYARAHINIYL